MASVVSTGSGTSPLSSSYEYLPNVADSIGDAEEAFWAAYNNLESDAAGAEFMPSPTNNSLGSSWAVLGGPGGNHIEPSPSALSPLRSDFDQQSQNGPFSATSTVPNDAHFLGQPIAQGGPQYTVTDEFVFDNSQLSDFGALYAFPPVPVRLEPPQTFAEIDFEDINAPTFQSAVDASPWEPLNLRREAPAPAPVTTAAAPDLTSHLSSSIFIMDEHSFISPSPPSHHRYSPSVSASPRSPNIPIKWEQEIVPVPIQPKTAAVPIPARKLNHKPSNSTATNYRITKPRKASPTDSNSSALSALLAAQAKAQQHQQAQNSKSPSPAPSSSSSGRSGSPQSQGSSGSQAKFLIVTPSTINAHAQSQSSNPHHQQTNPFECFEALRPSQRGRKGPLATDTKQSALQVRRKGACFCCHARKVRCDMERPCRNCVKLTQTVPQAVCWQFPDFLPVLFPDFIRGHFRKEEMNKFIDTSIQSFTVDGVERPCTVELYSGFGLSARLQIRAKFFTAKNADVTQHWHLQVGRNAVDLQAREAAPIGLEMKAVTGGSGSSGSSGANSSQNAQRDELKRKVREYIQSIVDEPNYASLVTEGLRHTDVPRKILSIVHDYANRADSSMVRRALSIYAMHFVLTRHLCLTPQTVADLAATKLIPQHLPWVTPRVLNRQIKAVIDDMLTREMQLLFENFSKSLKPKLRKEWAPCLAAFLVLCLFMESVETAADTFVISENEIALRSHFPAKWKRQFALNINKEMENMPFKQFAFQFHQIYQTYSRDAATRSFNPLLDDSCFELGELDRHAAEMVRRLRKIIDQDDREAWNEIDFLTADPILPNVEEHPYPRDIGFNYTGRLVAKFLLSFQQEKYIIGNDA